MAALPNGVTQEGFYNDSSLQGDYQYVSLKDIINNFQLMYVGEDKLINTIQRDVVIFHAKRGLQELNYDVLKQIKAIEIDMNPDTLTLILPEDYLSYVRVSWVDAGGFFHPMITNTDTKIADAYLQDNDFNILFDSEGNVLRASQNSFDQTIVGSQDSFSAYSLFNSDGSGGYAVDFDYGNARFGMETSKANFNGWFTVDKSTGVMKFSSNVGSKTIVLEYISDGLESSDFSQIRVHKFAEEALYAYIDYNILRNKHGIQEFIVRRKQKSAYIEALKAKTRLNGLTFDDLFQAIRGKDKRLK